MERRKALWVAPGLLTLAICGLHFTAMGAVVVPPIPRIAFLASDHRRLNAGDRGDGRHASLVMLALLATTLITSEGERKVLVRNQELVDAALEGLVVAKDGIVVNVNRRFLQLTLHSPDELLGKSVIGDS